MKLQKAVYILSHSFCSRNRHDLLTQEFVNTDAVK